MTEPQSGTDVEVLSEALKSHQGDFTDEPESFDGYDLIAANLLRYLTQYGWELAPRGTQAQNAALRAALQMISDALRDNNFDLSGLASQYSAVYFVGKAIQQGREVLANTASAAQDYGDLRPWRAALEHLADKMRDGHVTVGYRDYPPGYAQGWNEMAEHVEAVVRSLLSQPEKPE